MAISSLAADLLSIPSGMFLSDMKDILIIAEDGFSRVCQALLECEGYHPKSVSDAQALCPEWHSKKVGLIIANYPFKESFVDELKRKNAFVLILTDHISGDLIETLEILPNSFCMVKPLDYQKFKGVVREAMEGNFSDRGGYCIV
ncbi:conserved hypothetical protein [Candidatus Sulfobium mesophilum]|uniref:Response regulatory domain-containing protein n=1 Tax=Candidatus Sulfobium mesophilum TaxID=2016548 RepID=A0A2U3QDL3_9BACT|nr:conserved hypothetical protein [Candidatus Sulfobium mesophilum]